MSVAVQAHQSPEKFGVDTAQFEEITASKDGRAAMSKKASSSNMDKESDTETYSNTECNKKSTKKDSKSYYSTEEDSYDDDFESDAGESPRKTVSKNTARKSPSPKRNSSRSPETVRSKSPSVISPRSNKKGKGKRRFKPYESPRSSSPATSRLPPEKNWGKPKNRSANVKTSRIDHTVVDRVLSANRHKVTKLESRLSQLIKELTKEREENKTLRLIQHRQEKKLEKVIGEEAELPQLLVKHTAEVKSLRERIRKLQDSSHQKDEKIGEQDKTILKLKDKCKYYRELCEKEELTEKADLEKNLSKAEENLKKRDEEISKLQRMLNLKEKTHSRNLKEHKDKLRAAQERFKLMEENCNNLQGKLRVREKQLDYTNIYQRQIVLKEKGTAPPDSPPRMAALPAPKRSKPKGKNNTNGNKTKGKETKNNATGLKIENTGLSANDSEEDSSKKPNSVFLTAQSDKESGSDRDINKNNQRNDGKKLLSIMGGESSRDNKSGQAMVNGHNGVSEDELLNSERRKREDFERHLKEEDERLKREKEEMEHKLKELREREEREKAEREAKWREDSAKRAREAEERQLASAKKREEEKRKEQERRKEEERIAEERRREEERKEREKQALRKDSFFEDEEARRKKDALLARLKAIDSDKASDEDPLNFENKKSPRSDDFWKRQAPKTYEVRKADQNLHNGLPTAPRDSHVFSPPKESKVISPPESVKSDPDGVLGIPRHKPVLLGRGGLTKKRDNQLNWLDDNKKPAANKNKAKPDDGFSFGDYSPSMNDSKKKSDDIFDTGLTRRAGQGRRREGGPGNDVFNFGDRQGSGGNENKKPQNNSFGFLSDDFGSQRGGEQSNGGTKSPLLPRRRAAQERSGPAAISSAIDDDLDDIEEFTL